MWGLSSEYAIEQRRDFGFDMDDSLLKWMGNGGGKLKLCN